MTRFSDYFRVESTRLQEWHYTAPGKYFITVCTKNMEHYFGEIIDGEMILNSIGEEVISQWLLTPSIRPDMNISLDAFQVMPNHFHGIIEIGWNKFNYLKWYPISTQDEESYHVPFKNVFFRAAMPSCRDGMHAVSTGRHGGSTGGPGVSTGNIDVSTGRPGVSTGDFGEITGDIDVTSGNHYNQSINHPNKFGPQRKNLGSIMRGFKSSVTTFARKNKILFDWQPKYFDVLIRDDKTLEKIRWYITNNVKNRERDRFNKK